MTTFTVPFTINQPVTNKGFDAVSPASQTLEFSKVVTAENKEEAIAIVKKNLSLSFNEEDFSVLTSFVKNNDVTLTVGGLLAYAKSENLQPNTFISVEDKQGAASGRTSLDHVFWSTKTTFTFGKASYEDLLSIDTSYHDTEYFGEPIHLEPLTLGGFESLISTHNIPKDTPIMLNDFGVENSYTLLLSDVFLLDEDPNDDTAIEKTYLLLTKCRK